MWRKLKSVLILLFFAGLLQSCFSSGRNFPSRLDWIQKERTKKADVNLVLGKPYSVGSSSGTPTWTYAFYKYTPFELHFKELQFYWTEQDTVKSYTFNSSFPEDIEGKTGVHK